MRTLLVLIAVTTSLALTACDSAPRPNQSASVEAPSLTPTESASRRRPQLFNGGMAADAPLTPDPGAEYADYCLQVDVAAQTALHLTVKEADAGIEALFGENSAQPESADAAAPAGFASADELRDLLDQLGQDASPELNALVARSRAALDRIPPPSASALKFGNAAPTSPGRVTRARKGDRIRIVVAESNVRGVYAKGGPRGFADVALAVGAEAIAHTDEWPTGDIWARMHAGDHDVLVPLQKLWWESA